MVRIETDRLILRDQIESDLNDLHRLWSDKETMYYLEDIITNTIDESAEHLKVGIANADGHYFCICEKATGCIMGCIGYTITDTTPLGKIANMGYMLLPEFHRRGYMPEAVKKVIEYAFTKDDCIRITTGCIKTHEASYKVMEKSGFRKEAEKIKAQYHDGSMKDRLEYAINKDEFIKPS
jgi:ribosomal-protein-alanine N-acetyltransferase